MRAGSVAIRPFCGGLTGLLAGSVVAGYWQLEPNVFGGSNGGSVLSTGGDGVAVIVGVPRGQAVQVLEVARDLDEEQHAQCHHHDGQRP